MRKPTHRHEAMPLPDTELDLDRLPIHIAIVMDGNGRWAKRRSLPRMAGHRAGAENIRRIVECCIQFKIPYLTLFAFSTENWTRPVKEVRGLLTILGEVLEHETPTLITEGVRVCHFGRQDRFPPHLVQAIQAATTQTALNTRLTLNICFNYGGRVELVDAVRQIVNAGIPAEQIDESVISRYLYTHNMPDPDLIIRTAGEQRLSNFLVWQSAYSEYWFTPCYWPDFDLPEFRRALLDYSTRLRKFGKTPEQILHSNRKTDH
ncbi:MAG: polyprenyl diphosphate synthase [Chloroflexota bacterium]